MAKPARVAAGLLEVEMLDVASALHTKWSKMRDGLGAAFRRDCAYFGSDFRATGESQCAKSGF
jgi:hypothetical protein